MPQNKISEDEKRRVFASLHTDSEQPYVVIKEQERIAWVHAKGNQKWSDDRVSITTEELAKIAGIHLSTGQLQKILDDRRAADTRAEFREIRRKGENKTVK